MDKSYIRNFSSEDSWKMFQLFVSGQQFDEIVLMAVDGYTFSSLMFDTLIRLHKEDIIKRILKLEFFFCDESAKDFLNAYLGKREAQKLLKEMSRRRWARQDAVKQALIQEQKDKLQSLMAVGLTKDLFDFAEDTSQWQDVITRFGESTVYHAVKPYFDEYMLKGGKISNEIYWSDGDFSNLSFCYHTSLLFESTVHEFCTKVAKFEGGSQALYSLQQEKVDEWLCENGYKSLFPLSNADEFIRLENCNCLDDADWEAWYQKSPQSMLAYADQRGLVSIMVRFKQRKWLFKRGYCWKALTC